MVSEQKRKEYLIILFVAGVLALNYPLLSVLDRMLLPLGIPLLYFYIFTIWLIIIAVMASIVERFNSPTHNKPGS
jgi:hypothetical protein